MDRGSDELVIQPRLVARWLFGILAAFLAFHITGYVAEIADVSEDQWMVRFFDMNREYNLPTFFSAQLLFISSLLLVLIAFGERQDKSSFRRWMGLAAIFLFLSADEILGIHEQLSRLVILPENWKRLVFFRYPWVIPYSLLTAILAVVYWRFFFKLPERTRLYLALAACLYLGGAVVMESFSGFLAESGRWRSWKIIVTLEELLENLGLVVFIYTLISYAGNRLSSFRIRFGASSEKAGGGE